MEIPTVESSMLVLIDLQQKLVPAMAEPENTVGKSALLLRGAGELGLDVLVSEQYPQGLGNTVPLISTWLPDTAPVVAKKSFSVFGEPELVKVINAKKRKTLIFAGVETHVCVLQSVLDAIAAGYEVIVVSDAVCSRKIADRDAALAVMRQAGAWVLTVETVLFMLLRSAGNPAFKSISKLVK